MPTYDENLAPDRPGKGYQSHTARSIRFEHESLAYVFADWDERTREASMLYWGGLQQRKSKIYMAAVVVDHPQLDKFAGCGMYLVCIL
jgi:hypothetical protein